MTIERHKFQLW